MLLIEVTEIRKNDKKNSPTLSLNKQPEGS
jgi:hypothetical protein